MKPTEQMSQQEQSFRGWFRAYLHAKLDKERMISECQRVQDQLIELLNGESRKAMDEWQKSGASHEDVLEAMDEMCELVNEDVRNG